MAYELMSKPIPFGGLNLDKEPGMFNGEAAEATNVRFTPEGGITTFNGYGAIMANNNYLSGHSGAGHSNKSTALYQNETGNILEYNVDYNSNYATANAPYLYMLSSNGTTYVSLSGTLATSNCAFLTKLNSRICISFDGTGSPAGWVEGYAMINSLNSPTFKYSEVHYDRLFGAYTAALPDRLFWSAIADPTTWGGTDYIEIGKDDNDNITGIKSFLGDLYVFKKFRVYKIVGDDFTSTTTGNYSVVSLPQLPGCLYASSIVVANGKMYWYSTNGMIEFDGSGINYIGRGRVDKYFSKWISDSITTSIPANLEIVQAVHNASYKEIWFALMVPVASVTAAYLNPYIYNYELDKWSKLSPASLHMNCFAEFKSQFMRQEVMVGSLNQSPQAFSIPPAVTSTVMPGTPIYKTDWLNFGYVNPKRNFRLMMEVKDTAGELSCDLRSEYNTGAYVDRQVFYPGDADYDQFNEIAFASTTARRVKFELSRANTLGYVTLTMNSLNAVFEIDTTMV